MRGVLGIVALLSVGATVCAAVGIKLHHFRFELRYLNMEIARSEGEEAAYWRARRRRLWLSLLPFVRY